MSDYDTKAAKGQAYNLAVHRTIAEGRADDIKYLYALYVKYYEQGQLFYSATVDDVKGIIHENPLP